MIVQCPACQTRYRTDRSYTIDETTRFQCTKDGCGHKFSYIPPLLAGARVDPPPTAPLVSEKITEKLTPPPPPLPIPDDILAIPSEDPFTQEDPMLTKPLELPEEELADQSEIAETFVSTDAPFYADDEAAEDEQAATRSASAWAAPAATVSPGMFLIFLGLLVFGNGLLGMYCFYHPTSTEAVLTRLPVLGDLVAGERFSAQHIILSNLEGRYQTTKDNQKVFAVSGSAINNAAIPARTIQIEGVIYDAKEKAVGRRLIFCGTNIAPERLSNLTLREIGALQDLVPPKQFHVAAGDAVKFLIVFTTPPATVAEFSSRVVTAQFGSL